jgi:hypothetical protein
MCLRTRSHRGNLRCWRCRLLSPSRSNSCEEYQEHRWRTRWGRIGWYRSAVSLCAAPTEGYVDISVEDAGKFAERYGLLQAGGSDCHGPDSGKLCVGKIRVSEAQVSALRERADQRRPLYLISPSPIHDILSRQVECLVA